MFSFANNPQKLTRALWLLTLVGLAIRVIAVIILNDYRDPLTAEYGIVARNLVEGKGFVGGGWLGPEMPTALNTPVYPLFLAAWLWLGGPLPFLGVELCQALLSALVIYFTGKIASHLVDSVTGLFSALLITFYPPLIYFCKQISPAIFTTFFASLSFYSLLPFLKKPTWNKAIISGLIWGISLLVEPVLLLALPGAMLLIWKWWYASDKQRVLQGLIVSILCCSLMVLPWAVRNYIVFHRVILFKTSFGLNLWLGNNPHATGFLYTASGEPMQDTIPPSELEYLASLNEAERYAVLERKAWTWIKSNPLQFLLLTLRRIAYFWVMSPTHLVTSQNIVEPKYFYTARLATQAGLLASALVGSVLAYRRNRKFLIVSLWWLLAFMAPYAISVAGNTRYRLPVEPVLIMLSALFFCKAIEYIQAGRSRFRPAQPAA